MIKVLDSPSLCGRISAVSSKSEAHRLLICAALADRKTRILCPQSSEDIDATVRCLKALGAGITHENGVFSVEPILSPPDEATLDCGESGSTLRFLLPVACALGTKAEFIMRGRLSERPLSPLIDELKAHGTAVEGSGNVLRVFGRPHGSEWSVAASISSQFVSGLLFMLSLTGGRLSLSGKAESVGYIDMTCRFLEAFGAKIKRESGGFDVQKCSPLRSPSEAAAGGDWSNAAFFLVAGAVGKNPVTVDSLDINSPQGDRRIVEALRSMNAKIRLDGTGVTAYPSELNAADIDASDIPDLVPILGVAAAAARGTSRIFGASRLRLKESDRLESTAQMLKALGAEVKICADSLIIEGGRLCGGSVSSANDHRIAMSAAVAATLCCGRVILDGAQAVNKSYPDFWLDYERLCKNG